MKKGRIEGKVALITGGASGIGLATAILFREEGAEVIITDIKEPETNNEMTFLYHDITEEDIWENIIRETISRFGKLDILVNSAGINGVAFNQPQDPEHISIEQFRRVMSVNAEGTLLGCKHAIEVMKNNGGAIVNVGSLSAHLTLPGMFDYGSSKSVIRYLTRCVALYCAEQGYNIRCNLVSPGAIYTPLWESIFGNDPDIEIKKQAIKEKIPLKVWGTPEDVAYAILYLASDEAKFVTGADLSVDGGQLVKGQPTRGQ
ncbi:MAG: SDR family oxidoreductase [Candidatus Latescibacteria bacterium]|nr:SDR family oxidoreductase [Candidatus Latescibacterota bacterium]